jgi:hypothetical protein
MSGRSADARIRRLVLAFTILLILPATASASSPHCTPEQGQAFIDEGNLDRAVHEFSCVVDANPTEVAGYVGRAEARLLQGRFSDAYHDYNTGITALVAPVDPDAFSAIFDQYVARLSVDPNSIPALTGASFARWVNFDYPHAITVLNRLLAVAPSDVYGTLFRGSSRLLHGNATAKGVAELNRAIDLNPDSPDVHYIVADAYTYGLFDPERAAAEARIALDGGLDTPRVHAILAASSNALGDMVAAAEHIERHLDLVTTELVATAPMAAGTSISVDLVPGRTYAIPLPVTKGSTISISTGSPDMWDTIGLLLGPDGSPVLGTDDDDGDFAAFDHVATASGTYVFHVTSFEAISTGELLVERS